MSLFGILLIILGLMVALPLLLILVFYIAKFATAGYLRARERQQKKDNTKL